MEQKHGDIDWQFSAKAGAPACPFQSLRTP